MSFLRKAALPVVMCIAVLGLYAWAQNDDMVKNEQIVLGT